MEITGTKLRLHRQELGLSQAKLAEIANVPQHLLSAFELEKADLPLVLINAISTALANKDMVKSILTREKRYSNHEYIEVKKSPERIAKSTKTAENENYVRFLSGIHDSHLNKYNKQLSALSLFSGCGGFSLGFSAAGYLVKGFLEIDDALRDIYKLNFPSSVEIGGDITKVTQEALVNYSKTLGAVLNYFNK